MSKSDCQKFIEKRFSQSIREFSKEGLTNNCPELDLYEKVLIYEYTKSQLSELNEGLRESKVNANHRMIERLLNHTLLKLPDYRGAVYRSVNLSSGQIQEFEQMCQDDRHYVDPSFCSTSTSPNKANAFGSVRFVIHSKTGKSIERLSKFGINNPSNEEEVLFRSGTEFVILEVTKTSSYSFRILMEEVEHAGN